MEALGWNLIPIGAVYLHLGNWFRLRRRNHKVYSRLVTQILVVIRDSFGTGKFLLTKHRQTLAGSITHLGVE